MKVIKPIAIAVAQLISSTVPEDDYPAYDAGLNYAVGAHVIYGHVVYECVQAPNTGHMPGVSPLYWAPGEATNRWLMFDSEVSTQTVASNSMTVVLKPGLCNSLAFFGLLGSKLRVTVRNGLDGPVVYSRTINLDGTIVANWYQYFFEPTVQLTSVVLLDLPPYGNAHITITLEGTTVKCGQLVVGTVYDLGGTRYGAGFGITDYSKKETNLVTGKTTFKRGKFTRNLSFPVKLNMGQVNKVVQVLEDLRATPCVWIGSEVGGYESLTVWGFYNDFSLTVDYFNYALYNLDIQGLI